MAQAVQQLASEPLTPDTAKADATTKTIVAKKIAVTNAIATNVLKLTGKTTVTITETTTKTTVAKKIAETNVIATNAPKPAGKIIVATEKTIDAPDREEHQETQHLA